MATAASGTFSPADGDERFFLFGAVVIALLLVAGFSTQLAMGRSTFASPPLVHAHAIVFMGWVTIFVLQNVFVSTSRMHLHRRLGWIAAAWLIPMLILGLAVSEERIGNTTVWLGTGHQILRV